MLKIRVKGYKCIKHLINKGKHGVGGLVQRRVEKG